MVTVYDKVKCLCDAKDISIRECERQAGVGNGTIAGWQKSSPTMKSLKAVANVLQTTITELTED